MDQTEVLDTPPDAVVETLLLALEMRSTESAKHSLRVANLSMEIGKKMGISQLELIVLRRGALLHDIGRIGVPDDVLNKVEELTSSDWALIRCHPDNGAKLLRKIPSLQEVIQVVAFHHERWDGAGYPRNLKGPVIPPLARICAIAEVYDSLVSDQPYRRAWPKLKALATIEQESGKGYDPVVVKAFLKTFESAV